jgi:uncharacterized phage protein (TIGR02218 family)
MPRLMTRDVLREIRRPQLAPIEILDIATEPPYDDFDHHFVNNIQPIRFDQIVFAPFGWERGPYEAEAAEGVDRITFQLDDVEKYWANVVQSQTIQGCRIRLRKVFLGKLENPANSITIFDGFAGAPAFDDETFNVEVRSVIAYYETELPTRTFQPSCPYFFGEERCGVDVTTFPNRVEIFAGPGSNKARLKAAALGGFSSNHFVAGYVHVVAGPDKGLTRPIETSVPGEVRLYLPFPHPLENQKVRIVRGCRKTKFDCDALHNNLPNYGGFSEVPKTPVLDV